MIRCGTRVLKAGLIAGICWAGALSMAVAAPPNGDRTAGRVPANGAAITFGRSDGVVAGFCSRAPAVGPAYTVSIFQDGRVVKRGVPRPYPAPQLSAAAVHQLVLRARGDRFFKIPTYLKDVSCAGAATTYVRIRSGRQTHTVEVYGYLDSRHPALRDLLQTLAAAIAI